MKIVSILFISLMTLSSSSMAFMSRPTQFGQHYSTLTTTPITTTALPVLKDINIEQFLTKAKLEFEKFLQRSNPKNDDNKTKQKKQKETDPSYHKGGNARYQNPVVRPSKLEEECEETIIDFATGDELCWGESSTTPKDYAVSTTVASSTTQNTAMQYSHQHKLQTRDEYHKGGNAHYQPKTMPRTLSEFNIDECEEQNRYIDFATGDELCWAD